MAEVVQQLEDPSVWNDAKLAQDLGRERRSLEAVVNTLIEVDSGVRDARELFEMARAENDDDTLHAALVAFGSHVVPDAHRYWVELLRWRLDAYPWRRAAGPPATWAASNRDWREPAGCRFVDAVDSGFGGDGGSDAASSLDTSRAIT